MKQGKKLILKKEIIDQLNEVNMSKVKGGINKPPENSVNTQLFGTHFVCLTIKSKGCRTQNSCTNFLCFD